MRMIKSNFHKLSIIAITCGLSLMGVNISFKTSQASQPEASVSLSTNAAHDFQNSARALKKGDTQNALKLLTQAADKGLLVAQWQLAQIYLSGTIIRQDEEKAASIFKSIIQKHSEISPKSANAKFVSNSYVALSKYYRSGLKSYLVKNQFKAKELLTYSATYFGDPDAQYLLGSMYLNGEAGMQDGKKALMWLRLAARKNHTLAKCAIGKILFYGEAGILADKVKGLVRLQLAQDSITKAPNISTQYFEKICVYTSAYQDASDQDRIKAAILYERLKGQNEGQE